MEAAKIELIEEQLNDLLSMLGCPEKSTRGPNLSDSNMFCSAISPLERILKTKPIWHCPDITREEAVRLLQNKKIGNFIVRGSRQPQTLALSVRLTDREDFPPVQHFIIIIRGRKVAMEDSDLQFDNIVSLAFHYTQVCDELPERLTLPDVLATASSLQNLVSLSLLGKSFWSYPMAKSDRSSLALAEETSQEVIRENKDAAPLTRTPPRPPNRSRTSSQPQPHPVPHPRSKARRKSDSVPFIISPARVARPARHSLADLYRPPGLANSDWVTSPVFTNGGRDSPPVSSSRTRKVSVFYNKLGHVEEDEEVHDEVHEDNNYSDPSRPIRGQYSGHVTCVDNQSEDEDEDYAFPLDAIKEDEDHASLYENPHQSIRDESLSSGPIRGQDSDTGSDLGNGSLLRPEGVNRFDSHSPLQQRSSPQGDRRKLSLGVILRKLSSGSQPGRERKTSLQERRLSSALSKLITPIFERRTLGERSYQVNSLSWEFLNKDADEECLEGQVFRTGGQGDKEIITRDKEEDVSDKVTLVMKHPSNDSLYESEFDSSSTLESTNSITSTRHQHQHVNNIVIQ